MEELEASVPRPSLLRGAAQSLGVIAAFLVLGFGPVLGESALRGGERTPYPGPSIVTAASPPGTPPPATPPARTVWIVDGFNVLHVSVLRGRERGDWWRAEARERLLERVRAFEEQGAEVWVVFDGPKNPDTAPDVPGPRVVFAPSADEWVLARIRAEADPARVTVVTADRRLAGRSQRRGVRVVAPREFLTLCGPAPGLGAAS